MSNERTDNDAPRETRATAAEALADRYVAVWNELDADRRRQMVAELWTQDARHLVQAPQEIRAIAAGPGVGLSAIIEARGHAEIEARAASASQHWVGSEGVSFRRRDDAEQLGDVLKFHWEGLDEDGALFAVGLHVLILAADGRIERDYTFVGP